MLEWLAAGTVAGLGKLVSEQVLNLGKATMESYVQDFFKDCIQSGVAQADAAELQQPMAEAIGVFIKRVVKELQFNNVPDTSIDHYYSAAIKRFVQEKPVRPILGKAFEKDCKAIDYKRLEELWLQTPDLQKWQFPTDEFDWKGVAKEYVFEVKGIIKSNPDLRAIITTELIQDIAHNTAQISPGFDVEQYRQSLQCSYGNLKLYSLDTSDRSDTIKLWNMFIEQTVREALPPSRFELPLDLKRRMQMSGELEADLSDEELEHYRRDYLQKPSEKVLKALQACDRAIVLGDPGAGKSTLLQYLALEWAEGKSETLPLLVELRDYTNETVPIDDLLEFFHRGRSADWQFDRRELHQYLTDHPTLVLFDGLDEIFDKTKYRAVQDEIVRFTSRYPRAKVIVTSRVIGYNHERFRDAQFQHFTLQPLDRGETNAFIEQWYALAIADELERTRLKTQLRQAIDTSPAIQNLADNPLLLTMMAILNRRKPLPKNRAKLYEDATNVLLYSWDYDQKGLPRDAFGYEEKRDMVRLIAYEMQSAPEGLSGNVIEGTRLKQIITDYLKTQGFSEPREKATVIIQQLRERNYILCFRGADTYSFVHRTFLEYFCATEFVYRFEKKQTLTFEQLRDEVFGQHWQDETWHEVLRLVAGLLDAKFTGELIEWLMAQPVKRDVSLDQLQLEKQGLANLLLASECLGEVRDRAAITPVPNNLLNCLKGEIERNSPPGISEEAAEALIGAIITYWQEDDTIRLWLKHCTKLRSKFYIPELAVRAIAELWKNDPQTALWLKERVQKDESGNVRSAAVEALVHYFKDDPDTLRILKNRLQDDHSVYVLCTVVIGLAEHFKDDPDTLPVLRVYAQEHVEESIRLVSLRALVKHFREESATLPILKTVAQNDGNSEVRCAAFNALVKYFREDFDILTWLKSCAQDGESPYARCDAIGVLVEHFKDEPDTLPMLKTLAQTDVDGSVRRAALDALIEWFKDDFNILPMLKTLAQSDVDENVRCGAMWSLAEHFKGDPDTLAILRIRAQDDAHTDNRLSALNAFVEHFNDNPETLSVLKTCVQKETDSYIRCVAMRNLAKYSKNDSTVSDLMYQTAMNDLFERKNRWEDNPRLIALKALARGNLTNPKILALLRDRAMNDPDDYLKEWVQNHLKELITALKTIVSQHRTHPKMLELLSDIALNGTDEEVRNWAQETLNRVTAKEG